jgi:hypothetical protein
VLAEVERGLRLDRVEDAGDGAICSHEPAHGEMGGDGGGDRLECRLRRGGERRRLDLGEILAERRVRAAA